MTDQRQTRFTGRLKFYNAELEFGFIIKSKTLEDIFFHLTDMEAVGITAIKLQEDKNLFFSFEELEYMGRAIGGRLTSRQERQVQEGHQHHAYFQLISNQKC